MSDRGDMHGKETRIPYTVGARGPDWITMVLALETMHFAHSGHPSVDRLTHIVSLFSALQGVIGLDAGSRIVDSVSHRCLSVRSPLQTNPMSRAEFPPPTPSGF